MLIKRKRIPLISVFTIGLLPSFLKILVYKIKGYRIGKEVRIGFGSIIQGNSIVIGKGTRIGSFSFILSDQCIIEENVEIASLVYINVDEVRIGYNTVIRENNRIGGMDIGKSEIQIGHMSHIHQGCLINTTLPISIGNRTAIGGGSYIFTHSSWQSILDGYPCTFEPISIGHNVWISWNVFILPGVSIGDGTLVSASSVVSKSLPTACLASGNPAKIVIPSGLFPRQPHLEDRLDIISNTVSSFGEFIQKKGFGVIREDNNNGSNYIITDRKSRIHHLSLIHNKINSIPDHDSYKSIVIISLNGMNKDAKQILNNKYCLIDLSENISIGSNSLGIEIIKYFKHFGIHINRL